MTNEIQTSTTAQGGQITIGACYRLPDFEFYHADSLLKMKELKSDIINCILIDPPYKYLKNQKLEVDFDETIFFNEAKRVLKDNGFIVLFGRGTSFYRWNTMLADLGFNFKEEITWDKALTSSPGLPIGRVHETISIHSKGNGKINKVRIPYTESRINISDIKADINRLKSIISKPELLEIVNKYIESHERTDYTNDRKSKYETTMSTKKTGCREVIMMQSIYDGMQEKSIIRLQREHYSTIHPTQKPVRLLERLLALTTKEGDLVLDAFAGSCSTGEACLNTKRKFIGYEIDLEYYTKATERLKSVEPLLFSGCL